MYKSKLRYLMADKKINKITELMAATNVSRPPLDKLFNCKVQDLIEYIPDEEQTQD